MTPACIVDTNVAILANNSNVPEDLIVCALACIDIIEKVKKDKSLVLDEGGEIFEEYMHKLSLTGKPGVGDSFLKWVHDNQWSLPKKNRVRITKMGDSYEEFPQNDKLDDFDISDRKFVAVANAHPDKPKIYQGSDSKWWGWHKALAAEGIIVEFICLNYIERKYKEKMGILH